MAEYQEVAKQFNRMCGTHKFCDACIINNKRGVFTCYRWLTENPEKAEELIMKWAKEHPVQTNADKFKEVFGFDPYTWIVVGPKVNEWLEKEYKEPEDGRSNEN